MEADNTKQTTTKDGSSNNGTLKDDRLLEEMAAEMEVAKSYSIKQANQLVRKTPRSIAAQVTKKRKTLEKLDAQTSSVPMNMVERNRGRIRGSQVAIQELGDDALPLLTDSIAQIDEDEDATEFTSDNLSECADDGDQDDVDMDSDEDGEDDEGEDDDDESEVDKNESSTKNRAVTADGVNNKASEKSNKKKKKKKKKYIPRMKQTFNTRKLAKIHGEAMGAIAVGNHRQAMKSLQDIAEKAPNAPQTYSSLGVLYERMLDDKLKELNKTNVDDQFYSIVREGIELVQKIYSSFEVAASLCLRDYLLWTRCGDAAYKGAQLVQELMKSNHKIPSEMKKLRSEKHKWLRLALQHYDKVDKMRPPGLDIPLKLASTQMQMGRITEALSILVDLKTEDAKTTLKLDKESKDGKRQRTEIENSYPVHLLLADLMLKIGHSCENFNQGNEKVSNANFKKWLKEHSSNFNWSDKRLHYLVQSFEAAIGTKPCVSLLEWISFAYEEGGCDRINQIHEERQILVNKHKRELELFDKERNSDIDNWSLLRKDLLEKQHRDLVSFSKKVDEELQEDGSDKLHLEYMKPSSSCCTVFDIASQLMRHCILLKQFTGGRLVAEAVSSYLKFRAGRCKRKNLEMKKALDELDKRKRLDQQMKFNENSAIIEIESDSDDSVNFFFSDDEDFDLIEKEDEDGEIHFLQNESLKSLENGTLPPDIQALHAICVIGEGGRTFLASKQFVKCVNMLEEENLVLEKDLIEFGVDENVSWNVFFHSRTGMLRKYAALILLGDVIKEMRRNEFRIFANIFQSFIEKFDERDQFLELQTTAINASVETLHIRNQKCRILVAAYRCEVYAMLGANRPLLKPNDYILQLSISTDNIEKLFSIAETLTFCFPALWKEPDKKGVIPAIVVEACHLLGIISTSIRQYCSKTSGKDPFRKQMIIKFHALLQKQLSAFIGDDMTKRESRISLTDVWNTTSWQDKYQFLLSKCTFQMSVAQDVAHVSGWEENFSLDTLRARHSNSHLGLHMAFTDHVIGHIDVWVEEILCDMWEDIHSKLDNGDFNSFDFSTQLRELKQVPWYNQNDPQNLSESENDIICSFSEKAILEILLNYSWFSLQIMGFFHGEIATQQMYLGDALSVVLVLSEFATAQKLWDSPIGRVAVNGNLWQDYLHTKSLFTNSEVVPAGKRKKTKRQPPVVLETSRVEVVKDTPAPSFLNQGTLTPLDLHEINKPFTEGIASLNGGPLNGFSSAVQGYASILPSNAPLNAGIITTPNIPKLSTSALLNEWCIDDVGQSQEILSSEDAEEAMKRLDFAICRLRNCRTVEALHKQSVQVAAELLSVVAHKSCHNPFVCLHQAATFAEHSYKSPEVHLFRRPVPDYTNCTPLEALVILGRADCLRAMSFIPESLFLIEFVIQVCTFRRTLDKKANRVGFKGKWRVVAAQTYLLSNIIERTATFETEGASVSWKTSCKDELQHCLKDAERLETQAKLLTTRG